MIIYSLLLIKLQAYKCCVRKHVYPAVILNFNFQNSQLYKVYKMTHHRFIKCTDVAYIFRNVNL